MIIKRITILNGDNTKEMKTSDKVVEIQKSQKESFKRFVAQDYDERVNVLFVYTEKN